MTGKPRRAPALALLNPGASAATDAARRRLREVLGRVEDVDVEGLRAGIAGLRSPGLVVVAGGDGTVAAAARALIGTGHVLGVVPLGTYNNFARSLRIPTEPEAALAVIEDGVTKGCAVGRAGPETFLETALVGMLAGTIELGETVKEGRLSELSGVLARHARSTHFRYRISGDVSLSGRASSIVVANTLSTGASIPTGETRPDEGALELRIAPASGWTAGARALLSALLRPRPAERVHRVRGIRIETEPRLPAVADTIPAGLTPLEVAVVPDAVRVRVPRPC